MVEHVEAAARSIADSAWGAACQRLIDAETPCFAAGCQCEEVDHAVEDGHPALVHEAEKVNSLFMDKPFLEFGLQGPCACDDHVVIGPTVKRALDDEAHLFDGFHLAGETDHAGVGEDAEFLSPIGCLLGCLLYTSDAADE